MSFLDELGRELSRAGQDVMQGTRQTVDRVKLTAQIAEQERKIERAYAELGRRLYEAGGELSHEDYLLLSEPIDLAYDLIEQLREESTSSDADYCPMCGARLSSMAAFCSNCGEPIERCKTCGRPISKSAIFCNFCGSKTNET